MLLLQLSWFGTLSEACFEASLFAEHPDVSKPLLLSACMYACMHMLLLQLSWFGTLSEACFEAPLPASKYSDLSKTPCQFCLACLASQYCCNAGVILVCQLRFPLPASVLLSQKCDKCLDKSAYLHNSP